MSNNEWIKDISPGRAALVLLLGCFTYLFLFFVGVSIIYIAWFK